MARNITEVRLLNVPLENDYKHTLYFSSISAQTSYFLGKTVKSGGEFTYQRKDKIIRYPADYDELLGCNYVMYKNASYSNKWYYAFITKMEYINDGVTAITIETDVIQTWLFDYTVKPSFILREHVKNDKIGAHTVPEQLETGDYIINKKNKLASLLSNTIVLASTLDLNSADIDSGDLKGVGGGYYNGIYSGVKYYEVTHEEANKIIKGLAKGGQSDAITSIFMVPAYCVDSKYPSLEGGGSDTSKFAEVTTGLDVKRVDWVQVLGVDETENYKPKDIDGYEPKNNKLFTYPYCYMLMSNNSGGSAVYKYELFNNPDDEDHCAFYIYSAVCPGMSITISPRYYNGVDIDSSSRLNLGKFPICSWNTDVYTNWLTQNSVNIGVSVGSSLLSIAGGVAMATTGAGALAGAGAITSGALGIAGAVGEAYQHSLEPPQAEGNLNSGDVTYSTKTLTFTAYQMTIKKEYAHIIDNYFTMKGYKSNSVKAPNVNHRENFWYTQTVDVNIDGAIPTEDIQKIKDCYNNGITFWKNPSNIGDYTVSNNII